MRQSTRLSEDNHSDNYNSGDQYTMAYKRVKRIKGFYIHAMVFVLINTLIVYGNYYGNLNNNHDFWSWKTFSTAFFWGIGLTAHGLSVFSRSIFFGQNWENKKIKEFMDKEKSEKWE